MDCESAETGRYHPHLQSTFYYNSSRKLILMLPPQGRWNRPKDGGRLSRPMHCSKGVQCSPCPMLYRSGCRDKHNCRPRDLNLGPLTLQLGMLQLDHRVGLGFHCFVFPSVL